VKAPTRNVTSARSGADPSRGGELRHKGNPWFLALPAVGVVFGDIRDEPALYLVRHAERDRPSGPDRGRRPRERAAQDPHRIATP